MNICIPTLGNRGLDDEVCAHFGSAPFFTVVEVETSGVEIFPNANEHHAHGTCHPLASLQGRSLFAIVCGGMGRRAIEGLHSAGIKAYKATEKTARQTIEAFKAGKLEELDPDTACSGHGCH